MTDPPKEVVTQMIHIKPSKKLLRAMQRLKKSLRKPVKEWKNLDGSPTK